MSSMLRKGNQKAAPVAIPIYPLLAAHQRFEDWNWRDLLNRLQEMAGLFIVEFKLGTSEVVLGVDPLPVTCLGQFRYGHNGFGLKGEIVINSVYIDAGRPMWMTYGTLLHELVHAWQQSFGTPGKGNHHNLEFRRKARSLGLDVDRRGVTTFLAESPFLDLLGRVGVDVTETWDIDQGGFGPLDGSERRQQRRPSGKSKLNKWSCGCTNVRVAIADFRAMCLKCGELFRLEGAEDGRDSQGKEPGALIRSGKRCD